MEEPPQGAPQDLAETRDQQDEPDDIREKARGQEEGAGNEQAQAIEELAHRCFAAVQPRLGLAQGMQPLVSEKRRPENGGDKDAGQGQPQADMLADHDEQRDLGHGNDDEGKTDQGECHRGPVGVCGCLLSRRPGPMCCEGGARPHGCRIPA